MERDDDNSAFRFGDDYDRSEEMQGNYKERERGYGAERSRQNRQTYDANRYRERGGHGQDFERPEPYSRRGQYERQSYGQQDYGRTQNYGSQPRDRYNSAPQARDFDEGRHSGGFGNQTGFYNDRGREARYNASDRGWLERAGDEVASWFGDDDAAARRDIDHRGRGPKNYQRSDDKIREDVSERMFHDPRLDASNVELSIADGEVTLDGTVDSKHAKRRAEDLVDSVAGIGHVQNNLRVDHDMNASFPGDQRYGQTSGATPRSATRSDAHKDIASAEGKDRTGETMS